MFASEIDLERKKAHIKLMLKIIYSSIVSGCFFNGDNGLPYLCSFSGLINNSLRFLIG